MTDKNNEDNVIVEIVPDDESENQIHVVQEDGSLNMDFIELIINSSLVQVGALPPNYGITIKEMVYEVYEKDEPLPH